MSINTCIRTYIDAPTYKHAHTILSIVHSWLHLCQVTHHQLSLLSHLDCLGLQQSRRKKVTFVQCTYMYVCVHILQQLD